jgi:hypothetical protein
MKRLLTAALVISLAACGTALKVEPVQVQPIHVTVDVNLKDADAPAAPAAPSMK